MASKNILLMGWVGVGRTTWLNCFDRKESPITVKPWILTTHTYSFSYNNKKYNIIDVGDCDQQEEFFPLLQKNRQQIDAVILMYDISSAESYDYLKYLDAEVKRSLGNTPCIIVGNKADLQPSNVFLSIARNHLTISCKDNSYKNPLKYIELGSKIKLKFSLVNSKAFD